MGILSDRQTAEIDTRIGERAGIRMAVDVTPAGLLGVTVLVTGILLSTTILVRTAVREGKRHSKSAKAP